LIIDVEMEPPLQLDPNECARLNNVLKTSFSSWKVIKRREMVTLIPLENQQCLITRGMHDDVDMSYIVVTSHETAMYQCMCHGSKPITKKKAGEINAIIYNTPVDNHSQVITRTRSQNKTDFEILKEILVTPTPAKNVTLYKRNVSAG